jgi:hypothetical protein
MAARSWSWLLLLCLAAAADCGVLKARAQPDSIGKRSSLNLSPSSPIQIVLRARVVSQIHNDAKQSNAKQCT